MADHVAQTIADFVQDIERMESEIADTKRLVNKLCAKAGRPMMYADTEKRSEAGISSIRRDQWYGQGISTAMREYLEMRRGANLGPATVNEIHAALISGGFKFDATNDENAKRGLRISLTKNTSIFHRLPDGSHFGLIEWYPEAKRQKARDDADEGMSGGEGDTHNAGQEQQPPRRGPRARPTEEPADTTRIRLIEDKDGEK